MTDTNVQAHSSWSLKVLRLCQARCTCGLYHGRTDPSQEMDDWGFVGPTFGPLSCYVHTYCCTFRIHGDGDTSEVWLEKHDDMIQWRIASTGIWRYSSPEQTIRHNDHDHDDDFWDDMFHGCAFAAFVELALNEATRPTRRPPACRLISYYEEALATKNRQRADDTSSALNRTDST